MNVKLKGLNQRGKSRIASFGVNGEFLVVETRPPKNRPHCIFVESLTNCFRISDMMTTWCGWLEVCDTCGKFSQSAGGPYLDNQTEAKPWNCPVCGKEACSYCYWRYAAHKACCEGKTNAELIALANSKGFNFEEDSTCSECLHKDCTCAGEKRTKYGCVAFIDMTK